MKVSIDRAECTSCSLCWSDCPDIFEEDPNDGLSRIVEKFRIAGDLARGEAPDTLRKAAQAAADDCPVSVIHVE
ncbi:MAG TPA: ferredoxin [Spirochaetia bacterium]|nr:ferredoxin [Spirochaetia bacterium]